MTRRAGAAGRVSWVAGAVHEPRGFRRQRRCQAGQCALPLGAIDRLDKTSSARCDKSSSLAASRASKGRSLAFVRFSSASMKRMARYGVRGIWHRMRHRICRPPAAPYSPSAPVRFSTARAFYNAPAPERERVFHWLTPGIVAEVWFLAWTPSGEVRRPVFQALREDKAASAVTKAKVVDAPASGGVGSTRERPRPPAPSPACISRLTP